MRLGSPPPLGSATLRKAFAIMLAIMVAEAWPLGLIFASSRPGLLGRLFTTPAADWPAWIAAACVTAAYVAYAIRGLPLIGHLFFAPYKLKLLAIPFAAITGIMEEVWFRRIPMDWLAGLGWPSPAQLAFSAILFGLVHGVWGLFAGSLRVAAASIGATAALGLALALVYLIGDRHVAPCIFSHAAINLAIEPWQLVAAMEESRRKNVIC